MKNRLFSIFALISLFSFSQENNEPLNQLPLLITTGVNGNFNSVYNRLNALSKNISETIVTIERIDDIRQGALIISTENIGKSFNSLHIDPRPSLSIELQRVMFSGNNNNPNLKRFPVIIK